MEPQKVEFESTDLTFHGRALRSTQSFEHAKQKAHAKGSKIIRVYGIPRLVVDTETKLLYLGLEFSKDITEKIRNGELVMMPNTPHSIDEDTQKIITKKQKKRLKNSTRVWRKK